MLGVATLLGDVEPRQTYLHAAAKLVFRILARATERILRVLDSEITLAFFFSVDAKQSE